MTSLFRFIHLSRAAGAPMIRSKTRARVSALTLFAAGIACLCTALSTPANGVNSGQRVNLGPEDQNAAISVTIWLNLRNESTLDSMVQQMYDKTSPNYHHWLTAQQYQAQFAPTAQDAATVSKYLVSHNMTITSVDRKNRYVEAQTRVGDAQRAFNVQINRVMVNGEVRRSSTSNASIAGPVGSLIAGVGGLSDLRYRANVTRATNPDTGNPYDAIPLASANPNGIFFSADCLRPPETKTFTTNGGLPKATYTGTRFGADIANAMPPNLPPCGYDATEMQKAYGLRQLINNGLDGTGQTIVIVDAFGSNTILEDANVFSQLNGLPLLTRQGPNANFDIVKPTGPAHCGPNNGCIAGNWQFETTLDVEWAHAMAPNAKIVLVVAADNSFSNLDKANSYAIDNQLGSVISNSFGIPEVVLVDLAPRLLRINNQMAKTAAAMGISVHVSTGDAGDNLALDTAQFGIPVTSVGANSSPFITGIGGTSTFLDANNNIKLQTGWGLNFVRIAEPRPNPPTVPLLFFGFSGGAGGGTSTFFKKPDYQKNLPGNMRKLPDIAMNADPETGVEIIITPDSVRGNPQAVTTIGGTSLSTPMFSAVWALANQAAQSNGQGLLGQAAPLLYDLPAGAVKDVNLTRNDTKNNVTGVLVNKNGITFNLSANFLAEPQEPTTQYVSALFHSDISTRWDVFTFGTDSSLTTGPGWDNVTGVGTPNGENFINAVVAAAQP